jgi:hypothetical protein
MAPISHEYITDFGVRSINQFHEKFRWFDSFSSKHVSRIGSALYLEGGIHILAITKTIADLVQELKLWAGSYRKSDREQSNEVTQFAWDRSVQALHECVRLSEVDKTKQLVELAYVIADKVVSLAGLELAKTIFEIANAVKESKNVSHLLNADQVTAAEILLEFDLFSMTVLTSSQLAVAQVHALTRPQNLFDGSDSMEEAGRKVMSESKEFVVERVRQARRDVAEGGAKSWILFPEDGMWVDAPTF